MDEKLKNKLEKKSWQFGSTQDFLGLTDTEMQFIELKIALGKMLQEKRTETGYTQSKLAKIIGSSQPRVACMEAGDSSVTIDRIVRSLLDIGVSTIDICHFVESSSSP